MCPAPDWGRIPSSGTNAEEVSVFTSKGKRDDEHDATAVQERALSRSDREALAWLDEYLSAPQTDEDRRWGREFRRFLAEHRLDLSRKRD